MYGEPKGECASPNFRKWTLVSAISKKRRSSSPSSFIGARCFLPPPPTGSLRPVDIRPAAYIFARSGRAQRGDCSCPKSSPIPPTSTTRSLSQGKTFELIEQAAAYSGAADDDLVAQRIGDQEARIELITKRREEVLQSTNSDTMRKRHDEKSDQEEYGGDRS
jgi:hypothetical protein